MTYTEGGPASTSLKTYRYLRLSLVFVVFALLLSVLIQTVVASWDPFRLGWNLLPSISHYFYTPARTVFTGALIAASLALLALSGRTGRATLLDVSAIFAPLIAIIPTGVAPSQREGQVCPATGDCVPESYLDDVRLGIVTYSVFVVTAVIALACIRTRDHRLAAAAEGQSESERDGRVEAHRRETVAGRVVSTIALATVALICVLAFWPGVNDAFPFNFWPIPHSVHLLVTILFFGTFAAVPLLHGREDKTTRHTTDPDPDTDGMTASLPWQRRFYRSITWFMGIDLVMLIAAFGLRERLNGFPLVLIGEAVALLLFAAFWAVQTFERWDDGDAAYLSSMRTAAPATDTVGGSTGRKPEPTPEG